MTCEFGPSDHIRQQRSSLGYACVIVKEGTICMQCIWAWSAWLPTTGCHNRSWEIKFSHVVRLCDNEDEGEFNFNMELVKTNCACGFLFL